MTLRRVTKGLRLKGGKKREGEMKVKQSILSHLFRAKFGGRGGINSFYRGAKKIYPRK